MVAEEPGAKSFAPIEERTRSYWPDVVGVLWVLVAAFLALVPALLRGPYIGSFDFLSTYGLTAHPGAIVHNAVTADISDEVVPWIQAAWIQVHQGHVPLWIRDEALGTPLAFNFGSGAFSLPALVSYITPLRFVFWVQILVSLSVGGTGAYFFGRVLRLHPVACAFAGTTWVLSGPFWGYLGLPDTSVMSWAGWQFAAVVLILRGSHRLWSVVLFAVAFAFSILAGNPQIEVIILLPLGVFVVIVLLWRKFVLQGNWPVRRPIVDLAVASIAGVGLSAPFVLPGIQLANASVRTTAASLPVDPPSQVLATIFQSFWGQPLRGSFANAQGFYEEQWVYVGAIALALAVVAVGVRWRRPEVVGLAAGAVVAMLAAILEPMDRFLSALPAIGGSLWTRSLIPVAFCLAMLAAVGLDTVFRRVERRQAIRWALGSFGVIAVVLGLVWLFARGNLPAQAAHVRAESFVWPVVSTAVGLAAFAILLFTDRRSHGRQWDPRRLSLLTFGLAGALLICQTVFLVVDDGPIPSSSSSMYPPTPVVTALQRDVGSSLVGLGVQKNGFGGSGLGLAPDTNVPYGVDEFAVYDPIVPLTYFTDWSSLYHASAGFKSVYEFIPGIPSAKIARRYGISYVLVSRGAAAPSGSVFVGQVGNEDLYRIPGSGTATLVPASSTAWPSTDAPGKTVPVEWTGPSALRVVTGASTPQVLRLHVSSVPGWQATIDGRPLALTPYLSTMFQARIPPGRHVVELHYWPDRFTEGLVVAAGTGLALIVAAVVVRRRKPASPASGESTQADETDVSRPVVSASSPSVT